MIEKFVARPLNTNLSIYFSICNVTFHIKGFFWFIFLINTGLVQKYLRTNLLCLELPLRMVIMWYFDWWLDCCELSSISAYWGLGIVEQLNLCKNAAWHCYDECCQHGSLQQAMAGMSVSGICDYMELKDFVGLLVVHCKGFVYAYIYAFLLWILSLAKIILKFLSTH